MQIVCLILFLAMTALWFFTNEYDSLLGVYAPTCTMRRVTYNCIVFIGLLAALCCSMDVRDSLESSYAISGFGSRYAMLVLLLSLVVLMVLKFFGIRGSVIYAFLGSLTALGVVSDDAYAVRLPFVLSFLAAPFLAFVLSAVFRFILKSIFSKARIHMIVISYYMRIVLFVCVILAVAALGLNWGGMLSGIGNMILEGREGLYIMLVVIAVVMLGFMLYTDIYSVQDLSGYSDFSIYAVVSTGAAVAVTMILFSFDSVTSLVGLAPVPLSVSSLMISAIAGTELVQKHRLVSSSDYVKEAIAFVAAPGCAFVLTYLIVRILGKESSGDMTDFIVMTAAVLILAVIAFAGYVRRQQRIKVATEKLVYSQQQQIYENSRALNDMELKVVISENQALHNAVEMKRQEVMNVALSIVEQKEYLQSLNEIVNKLATSTDEKEREGYISDLSNSLRQRLSYDSDVDSQYFYAQAEYLHEDFNAKLSENFPDLTQQERRLAALLRLGFSSKYIASLMNITPKSVEISRYRLRQKLGLAKGDNLVNFIKSI